MISHHTQDEDYEIVTILHQAFFDNSSIEFVIGTGEDKDRRLTELLKYSSKLGRRFGRVYHNPDDCSCAIILDSSKKRTTLSTLAWDFRLLVKAIGLRNAPKVLKRERLLREHHPDGRFIHLWYIGVSPSEQGKGRGTKLLLQILEDYKGLPIYLETSNSLNFPFYEKHGFRIVTQLSDLGYPLRVYLKPAAK